MNKNKKIKSEIFAFRTTSELKKEFEKKSKQVEKRKPSEVASVLFTMFVDGKIKIEY